MGCRWTKQVNTFGAVVNNAIDPADDHEHQRVYFIAEGECVVRRPAKDASGALGPDGQPRRRGKAKGTFDADTVSVLGPLDIFGLPHQPQDLYVETSTQVGDRGGWAVAEVKQPGMFRESDTD